jgi:hypothetical protein
MPPSLNFPQLDFVEPSSGFHPVTWERVINHPPPIQYTTILNKGSENWAEKYNALEARICELKEKMNAMTLELKEVCQTVLPSSSVPLPTQPSCLGANPKTVAEVTRWFFPSWEPLEP